MPKIGPPYANAVLPRLSRGQKMGGLDWSRGMDLNLTTFVQSTDKAGLLHAYEVADAYEDR